mmetsp:Transcript_44383/g.32437  ORF Transcript_44383/g.32437 Transcript_44383/m.32437 type:complete len:85 (+) Transcript_44383:943-1197(+)
MEVLMLSEEVMFFEESRYRLNYDFEVVEGESMGMKLLKQKSVNTQAQKLNDQFLSEEAQELAELEEAYIAVQKRESSIDFSNDE